MSTFGRAKNRTRRALCHAGVAWAIGGCDISMNERKGHGHWQPHMVVFTSDSIRNRALSRKLRERFRRTKRVPRPVRMLPFDGMSAGLAYAMKTEFIRRVTLPKVVAKDGSTARRRNTRDRPLRAKQKVELMLALDRAGLIARMFCHGVEIQSGKRWPEFRLSIKPEMPSS